MMPFLLRFVLGFGVGRYFVFFYCSHLGKSSNNGSAKKERVVSGK